MDESTSNEGSATTDGNALPNRDPADVTRFKAAAAKRVQAHRWRRRLGLLGKIIMAQPSPLSALSRGPKSCWRRSGKIRFERKRLGQGKSSAAVMSVRS